VWPAIRNRVARQLDRDRQYAVRKGWTIDDANVFVDYGISGAEFSNPPGFLRRMNAIERQHRSKCSSCPKSHDSAAKLPKLRTH
jgi:DNA invertase Pin-like site-specific DNA recombinase